MSTAISFRKAKIKDLGNLSRLVNSAYRGDSSKAGWTTEADLLDGQRTDPNSLRDMLKDSQVIILAETSEHIGKGTKLLGCVYLKKKNKQEAYLGMLTILPTAQAQGLGKKVLEAGENFARDNWKVEKIEMTVISVRTELISWYERRGYKNTLKNEAFPYGDERFGIPKRPDLVFVVLEKAFS